MLNELENKIRKAIPELMEVVNAFLISDIGVWKIKTKK